jgi:hypothetical protein
MSGEPRVEFGTARSECGCEACVVNCMFIPAYLKPGDRERLLPPDADPEAWDREHLRASPGALVLIGGQVARIPTIVPATVADGLACHWLKDGRCTVHADAPFGCAFFSCKQTGRESDLLSAQGLYEILADRRDGGPYSQLWARLWAAGLRSPEPAAKRAAMEAYTRRQESLKVLHSLGGQPRPDRRRRRR